MFISEKDRVCGALFGVAAGDAVGLTFEGMLPAPRRGLSVAGGGQFHLPQGSVTDDTLMTLVLAESYLSCRRFDRENFLPGMVLTVQTAPATFGRTTSTLVRLLEQGCCPKAAARAVDGLFGSGTDGSVMRTVPVGLVCSPDTAADVARRVSAFTHVDRVAGECCAAVAVMVAVLMDGGLKEEASTAAGSASSADVFSGDLTSSVDAVCATRCAVSCFTNGGCVRDVIERAVSLGGDTDTIAAIAGGLAGAYWGMDSVPREWVRAIDLQRRVACAASGLMSARFAARRV